MRFLSTNRIEKMIRLEQINKMYNNGTSLHVLKGIDLNIEKGEFVYENPFDEVFV